MATRGMGAAPEVTDCLAHAYQKEQTLHSSLVVQWLGFRAFTAKGLDSVPGRGTKILQATLCGQKT